MHLDWQGRGGAPASPPQHVWESLAQFAPEAAELACRAADAASAAQYFAVRAAFLALPCVGLVHARARQTTSELSYTPAMSSNDFALQGADAAGGQEAADAAVTARAALTAAAAIAASGAVRVPGAFDSFEAAVPPRAPGPGPGTGQGESAPAGVAQPLGASPGVTPAHGVSGAAQGPGTEQAAASAPAAALAEQAGHGRQAQHGPSDSLAAGGGAATEPRPGGEATRAEAPVPAAPAVRCDAPLQREHMPAAQNGAAGGHEQPAAGPYLHWPDHGAGMPKAAPLAKPHACAAAVHAVAEGVPNGSMG